MSSCLVQGSEEWLEMRKNKIGASDAPILMGVSPWSTPYRLWCEKLSLVEPRQKTFAMNRGLELEDEARHEFEMKTGLIMFPDVVFSDEFDFMMASLDGIDIERKNIVEIKCPGKEDHEMAMDGIVPEKYIPQLHHQMIVSGLDKCFYFSYTKNSSKVLEVERSDSYNKVLISKEKEFWRCIQDFESPKLCEKDYDERTDDLWVHAAMKWKEAKKNLEMLEEQEKDLRQSLICLSGKSNVKGAGIKLLKVVRKGSISYQEIPELSGLNLERYRKPPIETWRLGEG